MKFSVSLLCLLALSVLLQGCSGNDGNECQGYVEGEYVYLSSARAGRLEKLLTRKGSSVEAGVLLASLESEYERQAVAKSERSLAQTRALYNDMLTGRRPAEVSMAKAQLAKARADQANAAAELARVEALYRQNAVSRKELDNQRAVSRSADATVVEMQKQVDVYNLPEREQRIAAQKAAVEAGEADLAQARWELDQKEIRPQQAGLVYDTLYRVGEWVPAGSPVIQLLPPGNVKIRFFTYRKSALPPCISGRPSPSPWTARLPSAQKSPISPRTPSTRPPSSTLTRHGASSASWPRPRQTGAPQQACIRDSPSAWSCHEHTA